MTHHSVPFVQRLARLHCLLCCCACLLAGVGRSAEPAKRAFDLPADSADKSLRHFALQSGFEVLFATQVTAKVQANTVRGEFTPHEALDRLLTGTGLTATQDARTGAFTVTRSVDPNVPRAAQSTASDRPKKNPETLIGAGEEKVIELSPFVITAEQDTGYQATSTLAGTRLRTDLRDLAASISVVTKELMEDLAVNSLDQLATYTLGTEIGGADGNFSDTFVNADFVSFDGTLVNSATPVVRVRGITGDASRTRDYFLTDIGGDAYNIDRIDMQRGPNGMLFGLGSPQGVINDGMIKANPQRNSTKVSTRFGSYDGYRGSIDHNQVLLKDKLALRLAGVYDDRRYQIEEAFIKSRRGYGTLTYKPWKNTVLRVSGESALTEANPAQTRPPSDQFSYWWAVGRPVYNAFTGVASFLGTPPSTPGITGDPNQFLNAFVLHKTSLVIENAATGAYGLSIPGNPQAIEGRQNGVRRNATNTGWVTDGSRGLANADFYLRTLYAPVGNPARNFYRQVQLTDPSIFNFFDHQLDGPASSRNVRWRTANIALEQRLGQHAGLELAYDRQTFDFAYQSTFASDRYALNLDVTSVLLSGLPNPNFGRPFAAHQGFGFSKTTQREAFRATTYYDLDFKRFLRADSLLAKIIGRHVFTGNYTGQSRDYGQFFGTDGLGQDYLNQEATSFAPAVPPPTFRNFLGARQIVYVAYLGQSAIGTSGPQGLGIQGLQKPILLGDTRPANLTVYNYVSPPAAATIASPWTIQSFNTVIADDWNKAASAFQAQKTREKFKAVALVAQSHWFEKTLVSTVGWRRDWIKTFDAGSAQLNTATGVLNIDPAIFRLQPKLDQRHDAINYGLVLHAPGFVKRHLPKWIELSLTHNRSDNFTPQGARLDVYGRDIDPTGGTTKEFGALVSLFDRKIDLRISNYTTASTKATYSTLNTILRNVSVKFFNVTNALLEGNLDFFPDGVTPVTPAAKQAYLAFLRSPEATPFFSEKVTGYYLNASGQLIGTGIELIDRIAGTSDVAAKGWEVEATANPTKNWRVTFNAARQEAVLDNVGNELAALFESWKPALIDGRAGDVPGQQANLTLRDWFGLQVAALNLPRALQGSVSPEIRKWRFNFVNNYRFTEGRLKGWNVGGAVRWQDKVALGYPVILIEGTGQYDVTRPYYGPTETNVDAWVGYTRRIWNDRIGWKAQLNVRDIGVRNRLIPIGVQPNGDVHSYRTAASMTWSLTNSFTF